MTGRALEISAIARERCAVVLARFNYSVKVSQSESWVNWRILEEALRANSYASYSVNRDVYFIRD